MVVTPKKDGNPRRTVEYSSVNPVFENWHGYHSLAIASEEDKDLTTFITPFGRFRYLTALQGL